ncbi:hypothetical protein MHK_004390 [Candidatus Magnetomorum sp. HK-1]|nr:hypothetical protein MHK_004390 [Candidatus Magnetomorum sp. HK-1]
MRYVFIMMCIFWGITIHALADSIPQKISFQAKMIDIKTRQPVNDAKQLTFKIGDWVEIHDKVKISNGIYSVILGEINPIPLNLFNDWKANIKVFADGKQMTPDIEMVSSPYAFRAESASRLGNTIFCKDGHLGIGTSNPGTTQLAINAPRLDSSKDSMNSFVYLYNRVGNGDSL